MNEARAREEICRVGRSLFERGYAHATAGNISVRLDEGLLITPTDACLGFLDPAAPKKLMPRLNQLFNRAALTQEEIHILRGVAKAMGEAAKGAKR